MLLGWRIEATDPGAQGGDREIFQVADEGHTSLQREKRECWG